MINLLVIPLLCASLSAPVNNSYKEDNHFLTPVRECVSYNDSLFRITISSDELNDYTWQNLYDCYINGDFVDLETIGVYYNDIQYAYDAGGSSGGVLSYSYNPYVIMFIYNDTQLDNEYSYDFNNYHFYYFSNSVFVDFEYSLSFVCSGVNEYNELKTAIELDIHANQIDVMPSASDLFQTIGQGITGFIGNLGSAIQSVTQLFWTTGENAGPTFLGLLMLLSIGAGLIFLGFRLIRGLVYKLRG